MQRYSKNREAILACLRGTVSHPTAEWIYAQLKPAYPDLSLATVYRNLASLREAGLICSVGTVDGQERFDANVMLHPHAVCRVCGAVADVPFSAAFDSLVDGAENTTGFSVEEVSLRFTGLCSVCRAKAENGAEQ